MSDSKCVNRRRFCNGVLSLALVGKCSNIGCRNKKKLYLNALEECKKGNCSAWNEVVGNNNKDVRIYAINNLTPIDEKQMIAQAFRETGNPKFALEVSRSISGLINLSDTSSVDILESSLRFQGSILKSMNKINEANFILSTANHINSLANKTRL